MIFGEVFLIVFSIVFQKQRFKKLFDYDRIIVI